QMFTDKTVYEKGAPAAFPVKPEKYSEMKAAGYAVIGDPINGGYIWLNWRESILAYPFNSNTAKITNHGDPTRWYYNGN
ncbi:hypothetical protein RLH14_01340, partial [Streptococcus pneumoniae]|nr:hypothetical protein [Streptococcus pneumoniae]